MSYLDAIKEAVYDSFAEVQSEIVTEVVRVIETPGEFEGVDGDIVDTGRLRDSMIVDSTLDKLMLYWTATDPETGFYYPAAIIAGYFAYGRKYIPARNYPVRAVQNASPIQSLAEKLRDRGLNAKVISDSTSLL